MPGRPRALQFHPRRATWPPASPEAAQLHQPRVPSPGRSLKLCPDLGQESPGHTYTHRGTSRAPAGLTPSRGGRRCPVPPPWPCSPGCPRQCPSWSKSSRRAGTSPRSPVGEPELTATQLPKNCKTHGTRTLLHGYRGGLINGMDSHPPVSLPHRPCPPCWLLPQMHRSEYEASPQLHFQ